MNPDDKLCLNSSATPTIDGKTDATSNPLEGADKVSKIRDLNDRLRKYGQGGIWLATVGISSLPPDDMQAAFKAVITFGDFTPDNDPHDEHDCAVQTVGDVTVIWKIDYYDRAQRYLSPDPSDPKVTTRVLTVMLASEY